jgi:hypothetical protein
MNGRRVLGGIAAAIAALMLSTAPAFGQGEILYGADGASGVPADLLVIDPATAEVVEVVGGTGFGITGLAKDPTTGILYGVSGGADVSLPGWLFSIDERTGAATPLGDLFAGTTNPAADITFTSDGTLYGWSENSDDLVTINKATGAGTVVGNSGISTAGSGLAANATNTLYFAGDDDDGTLYTIDRTTGAPTAGPTMNGANGNQIAALAFNSAGTLFGARPITNGPRSSDLININITTGAITSLGGPIFRLDALEFVDLRARTVDFEAKPNKVRKGKKTTLSGEVSAPTATADCAAAQLVEIQKRQTNGFGTVKTVTTDTAGAFRTRLKIGNKPTVVRAVADGLPASCQDATSPGQKVKTKKEKE